MFEVNNLKFHMYEILEEFEILEANNLRPYSMNTIEL